MGKLETGALRELLRCIKQNPKVVVPPMPGFDSGVHEIGDDTCLVVSTDPCIGVPAEWFGWFLIHYAASDVALFGARPEYATVSLLAPPRTSRRVLNKAMKQACDAADDLGVTIVTGHTGMYDGISTLAGVCTAYGTVKQDRLITPGGARAGDNLLCTKPIGLETLVNFALTNRRLASRLFGSSRALELAGQVEMQTCVREALVLAGTEGVTAMHDVTEGGFVAALNEMAEASNVGFRVDWTKLQILPELKQLARHFRLGRQEALSTSSTGTVLAAVSPAGTGNAVAALSKLGLVASVVGMFSKCKSRLIKYDRKEAAFPRKANDPYARIMSRRGRKPRL